MPDLESGCVPAPFVPVRLSHEVDRKASFSVDETRNPADLDQSFLLIDCTVRFSLPLAVE
jgi:hypothetical protein